MTDLRDAIAQRHHDSYCRPYHKITPAWSDCGSEPEHAEAADAEIAWLASRDDMAIVGTTDPADAMRMFGAALREPGMHSSAWDKRYTFSTDNTTTVWVLPGEPT